MGFTDTIKLEAKRRACYRCCICEKPKFLHVHHIIPSEELGPDTIENAVALCVSCHDLYGHDKVKRKWVKEKRNWWYTQCYNTRNQAFDIEILQKINEIYEFLESRESRLQSTEEYYLFLREQIQSHIQRLNNVVSDLSLKLTRREVNQINIIQDDIEMIKGMTKLIETISMEDSEDYYLWKDISDYLTRIEISTTIPNEYTFFHLINKLLTDYLSTNILSEHSEDPNLGLVDIFISPTIGIEIKLLSSHTHINRIIGQLIEILRISKFKFLIGIVMDMTTGKQLKRYDQLIFGENRNIILIIK
ncbi:MAG: HNH endonuclease [Promethearchaeota archaeon]